MVLELPRVTIAVDPLIGEARRRMRVRRSFLALILLLGAGAAAGVALAFHPWQGGGYRGVIRQESKRMLHDGNPKIVRIETVHDLAGNPVVIATLHGHFTVPPANVPCAERCHHVPAPTASFAWLSFSKPGDMSGFQTTTASQIAAIDTAHRTRPVFGIFPYSATTAIRCAIPRGTSSRTITGSCSTAVLGSFAHPTAIRFHEAWMFRPSNLGYEHQRRNGGWVVSLDRNGHVRSIRRIGDLPPQLWK